MNTRATYLTQPERVVHTSDDRILRKAFISRAHRAERPSLGAPDTDGAWREGVVICGVLSVSISRVVTTQHVTLRSEVSLLGGRWKTFVFPLLQS
ncbi:hypothetical protein V2G26_010087 [Clonostachys chloroleuca]